MAPKHISQAKIIQHFLSLPDEQRVQLLKKHMTTDRIIHYGSSELKLTLDDLKKDPVKLKAFVRQKFGGSRQRLSGAVKKENSLPAIF